MSLSSVAAVELGQRIDSALGSSAVQKPCSFLKSGHEVQFGAKVNQPFHKLVKLQT